jgi:peptidoglycan/xylan/chitin deacetylase (PgdA/CDA1 family)
LRAVAPIAATAGRIYFPETGHILQYGFLQAWRAGGGLPVYGYPLTEEFVEVSPTDGKPYTVQYFERNRFEYHPENKGTPYEVQLGLLGAQRAAALNLLGAPAFRPLPAPPAVARVVSRGDATRPLVALTFDAGADRGNTGRILDTLAAGGIRASFGITGQWARANPDLVRRMAAEGHHVFNHTDDHRSFTGVSDHLGGLSAEERVAEVDRADAAIAPLIGRSTRPWFRSPYGDYDAATQEQLAADGYYYNVLWTIDSLGWEGLPTGAIVGRVLGGAAPGAIVLFHVGAASADAAALPAIVDGLRARGYGFATVEELVQP